MTIFGDRLGRKVSHRPRLSAEKIFELHREITDGFDARGFDSTIRLNCVELVHRESGLSTTVDISELIDAVSRDDRPHAIAAWTQNFIRATTTVQAVVNPDTEAMYTFVRLILVGDSADETVESATLHHVADGLRACLVFDTGDAVIPVTVGTLTELDDLATIERAARNNLAQELRAESVECEYQRAAASAAGCWILRSDGPYLSAAPLLLQEVLGAHLPDLAMTDGVLFAVPLPNVLLVAPVTSGDELAETLHMLAAGALGFVEHAGAREFVSARVYHWLEGRIEAVSSVDDHQSYLIEPNQYLLHRLQG